MPPFLPPHTQVSDCVLVMSGAGSEVAAMTTDGTANGRVLRLISSADLQPAFGDNPLAILHELASARDSRHCGLFTSARAGFSWRN